MFVYSVFVKMMLPKYRLNLYGYYLEIWHRRHLYNESANNISYTICGNVYDPSLCQVSRSFVRSFQ
jgi:hypothetical protein